MSVFPRSILLAFDGSEETELAARVAVELAKSTGAELHMVHVKLMPITLPRSSRLARRPRACREGGSGVSRRASQEGGGGWRHGCRDPLKRGRTTGQGDHRARRRAWGRPDRRGGRDRGRLRRALTGSVCDQVVRRARCPVLVVEAGARVAGGARGVLAGSPAGVLSTESLHNPYRG
jgi:hypothetical protein